MFAFVSSKKTRKRRPNILKFNSNRRVHDIRSKEKFHFLWHVDVTAATHQPTASGDGHVRAQGCGIWAMKERKKNCHDEGPVQAHGETGQSQKKRAGKSYSCVNMKIQFSTRVAEKLSQEATFSSFLRNLTHIRIHISAHRHAGRVESHGECWQEVPTGRQRQLHRYKEKCRRRLNKKKHTLTLKASTQNSTETSARKKSKKLKMKMNVHSGMFRVCFFTLAESRVASHWHVSLPSLLSRTKLMLMQRFFIQRTWKMCVDSLSAVKWMMEHFGGVQHLVTSRRFCSGQILFNIHDTFSAVLVHSSPPRSISAVLWNL